jgi:hypothetical protein
MNWPLLICGIALVAVAVASLVSISAGCAASRPTPPLFTRHATRRQPGENDSDMADRVLNASPYHQAELKPTSPPTPHTSHLS